jgi:hypothetical protein
MARDPGPGAGALVAQLLAFLREPARQRPRYTVGREAIAGGDHVIRFAQGKFPPQVLSRTTPAERLELREAAQAFIRQVCFWDGATHYQVLCAPQDARRAALKDNYHLLMALIHPDRRDADTAAWPRDCAQRVNRAYDTLGDDARRREYDASLERQRAAHIATSTGSIGVPPVRHRVHWPRRLAKAGLAFGVLVLALLGYEAVFSDHRHEILASLWTGSRSSEEVNSSRPPRYIHSPRADGTVQPIPEKAPFEVPVLTPLWRAITGSKPPPAHEDSRVEWSKSPPVAVPPPPADDTRSVIAPAHVVAQAPAAPQSTPADMPKAATPAPAPAVPVSLAPAPIPGLPAQDIEVLVVRLIDSYEAGDIDRLMALVDARDRGFWSSNTMRQSFAEFFRSTRVRKLHVSNLDWRNADHEAHARGQAFLRAEYDDDRGVVERNVDLEMDIALREGQPRIVRLKLFPNAS